MTCKHTQLDIGSYCSISSAFITCMNCGYEFDGSFNAIYKGHKNYKGIKAGRFIPLSFICLGCKLPIDEYFDLCGHGWYFQFAEEKIEIKNDLGR